MFSDNGPTDSGDLSFRLPLTQRALALLLGLIGATFSAQGAGTGEPVHGETVGGPVTPFSIDVDLRDLPLARHWRPGDAIREIPRRHYPRPGGDSATAPQPPGERDPLIAAQHKIAGPAAPSAFTTPIVNVAGINFAGASPPDTAGDVGPNHFIQSTNGSTSSPFVVYSKSGAVLAGPILMSSLAIAGSECADGWGDPIVLYDRLADRWLLQEFSRRKDNLCMYVSKGPDPVTSGWWFYDFVAPNFPDYPHYGVWPDAWYATTNENSPVIYAFDRANMLLGATARAAQRFPVASLPAYSFQALTAANFEGTSPPPVGAPVILMRHHDDEAHAGAPDATKDFLELWQLAINWTAPGSSVLSVLPRINVSEFNSWLVNYTTFGAVPQPGSATLLDPIREIVMQKLVYRNFGGHETLLGNFVTNLNPGTAVGTPVNAGVRWFELRRIGAGGWSLFQEGTFGPGDATNHHWLGAIGIDRNGDIALSYSRTKTGSGAIFPGLGYTGRLATDPVGVMTQGDNVIIAGSVASGTGRWGDYAAMGIDPADNCTFWMTGQYNPASQWATRIASFKFDSCCAAPAIPMSTQTQTKSGSNLILNWPAVLGAASYNVYRASAPNPAPWPALVTGLTSPGHTDSNQLASLTSQYYTVTDVNACGVESPK